MITFVNDIWLGWVPTTISWVLEKLPDIPTRFTHALISSIDSSRDIASLAHISPSFRKAKQLCNARYEALGKAIVVSSSDLVCLSRKGDLFTGFDEMWFFRFEPMDAPPDDISLVGPLKIVEDFSPDLEIQWMKRTGAVLGLGDGGGLNFASFDQEIAAQLAKMPGEDAPGAVPTT
jgi:hypothetical protein